MRRDRRTLELLLQFAAALAATMAVFQQTGGLRVGIGLLAFLFFTSGVAVSVTGIAKRRKSLTRRERRLLHDYYVTTIDRFLKELPLPEAKQASGLSAKVRYKSAYVAPPYASLAPGAKWLSGSSWTHRDDPVDLLASLPSQGTSAAVTGEPGTGKSLVLMLTFASLADRFLATRGRSVIPVFIRLNSLRATGSHTHDVLEQVLHMLPPQLSGLGLDRFASLASTGRICFLLDGIDELPSIRTSAATAPHLPFELRLLLQYTSVVSCREAFYDLYVDGQRAARAFGARVRLHPLTYEAHVVPFVQHYCKAWGRPEYADRVLAAFKASPQLPDTLSRPLILRMTVDLLCHELESHSSDFSQRLQLTGSDYLSAEIYERYVVAWIKREHGKSDAPRLRPHEKLSLVEAIASDVFSTAMRAGAGYGSFELTDLLIERPGLCDSIERWLDATASPAKPSAHARDLVTEIEERTFLIVGERGDTYRFVHKSFFEYFVARHVCSTLAQHDADAAKLVELLSFPLPDEVIDFLRELLLWARAREDERHRRRSIERSLVQVLRIDDVTDRTLMSRQQAANLLPIVATEDTRRDLRRTTASDAHPFLRRALAVGEALHHADSSLVDDFVRSLDQDSDARAFHMGYNRIYYGDQPLSQSTFVDDGSTACVRFFRACVRHLRLERYRPIRAMACASVRLMLQDPARRTHLLSQEADNLRLLREACGRPDPALGEVYERERRVLAELISRLLPAEPEPDSGDHERPELAVDAVDDVRAAGQEQRREPSQAHLGGVSVDDTGASLAEDQQSSG
jgi:hypothetical protein